MGWKSSIVLTKEKALSLIMSRLLNASNDELGYTLESLGYGENSDLSYFGHNFIVVDTEEEKRKMENNF